MLSVVVAGLQWALDRMVSVGYGVVYDFVFERFPPYRDLQREVLALLETSVPEGVGRRDVRVLDIGCGPGNFAFSVAEAGFTVVGIDAYDGLLELAREKRRAKRLPNLAFRHADIARETFRDEGFDQIVNIHSLYVRADPQRVLTEAHRVLKPGGHAVFVNFTRRIWLWSSFREVQQREGLGAAFRCLLWVLPNSVFEVTRRRLGPHYWQEEEFAARLRAAGFTVLAMRRTFFYDASLLAWVRKDTKDEIGGGAIDRTPGMGPPHD
ncbi:MAG TPA: methyltransferase domain-containing protein [Methylomirabilota bacterium]|nr:methyltransferase domain-containing protein [Methylomirabilota bacterium]